MEFAPLPGAETVNGRLADRLTERPAAHVAALRHAAHPARSAISAASAVVTRTLTVRLRRSASGFRGRALPGGLLAARGMSKGGSGVPPRPEVIVTR